MAFRARHTWKWSARYKLAAKDMLDKAAPLAAVACGANLGEAVFAVFNKINLLSPFEKIRVRELMLGSEADAFVRLSADFADGDRKVRAPRTEATPATARLRKVDGRDLSPVPLEA